MKTVLITLLAALSLAACKETSTQAVAPVAGFHHLARL